jgi:hypothetical protein
MKMNTQDLKGLLDFLGHEKFPGISSQLDPIRKKEFQLPCWDSESSRKTLALKMTAMYGLKKKATTEELVDIFSRMTKRKKIFVAYNLSHELKIASLAACIAMNNQDSNIYEIGPCFGFSSIHYSHLIKEKNLASKAVSKLRAIEINKEWFERALAIRSIVGDYVGEIEYLYGDGINYLRKALRKYDIVFASIAEQSVVEGIFSFSLSKPINILVSYSERTDQEIEERWHKRFEDLIDSSSYNVFPFEDREYNKHMFWETGKIGVLALPTS